MLFNFPITTWLLKDCYQFLIALWELPVLWDVFMHCIRWFWLLTMWRQVSVLISKPWFDLFRVSKWTLLMVNGHYDPNIVNVSYWTDPLKSSTTNEKTQLHFINNVETKEKNTCPFTWNYFPSITFIANRIRCPKYYLEWVSVSLGSS